MSLRICVVGNSGSGKSTLGKALGAEFGIPVYHLDRELLHGDFQKHPIEKRIKLQDKLLSGDSWVIDGNYDKLLPQRVERATMAVFLNTSRLVALPRVMRRARKGGQPADTVPDGAKQQALRWEFIKWVAGYDRRKRATHLKSLCDQYGAAFLLLPNKPVKKLVEEIKKHL